MASTPKQLKSGKQSPTKSAKFLIQSFIPQGAKEPQTRDTSVGSQKFTSKFKQTGASTENLNSSCVNITVQPRSSHGVSAKLKVSQKFLPKQGASIKSRNLHAIQTGSRELFTETVLSASGTFTSDNLREPNL